MALTSRKKSNRTHIDLHEIKYWAKHWKVSSDHIRSAIEKSGNAVTAVHKELILQKVIDNTETG